MKGSNTKRPGRPKPWLARYRGPDGVEYSHSFVKRDDGDRWLRQEIAKIDAGTWINPKAGKISYEEWSATWLRGLRVKPKTRAGYSSLLRSRVLPRFGRMQIRRISPSHVRTWIAAMSEEGLSASRIRQARQVLHASLEQAVADGLIGRNPTSHVRAPTDRPREQKYLDAHQLLELAAAADDIQPGSGLLVSFLGMSGVRWGEAVALRVSALDLLRRRVHVKESATEVGGRLEFGTPKSHRSRTVILPRAIVGHLSAHVAGLGPNDLVFQSPRGGPLRTTNFRRRLWQPALAVSGLPSDLRVHDLRHTAASLMISASASITAVQRQLGHASATLTLDRYSHLYDEDLEALADRLDERLARTRADQRWTRDVGGRLESVAG